MGKCYYLFEYVMEAYGNEKRITSAGNFPTIEKALSAFNKHLKGGYFGAPILGNFPEAFIVKGRRIPIIIEKTGIVKVENL